MSIRVEPTALVEHSSGRPFAYVLTTDGDRVHLVAHRVTVNGSVVTIPLGGDSLAERIGRNSTVTVLWPPDPSGDEYLRYSLVADGDGVVEDGVVTITVRTAVLHRPAP